MNIFIGKNALKISALMIIFLLLISVTYVLSVDIYTLGGDQMHWVSLIDKMYQGQLKLADLWIPHGSHRAPAYKAIFLVDAKYFGLNMQLEQVLGAFAWAGAGAIAVLGVAKHLGRNRMNAATAWVLIATPSIIINGQVFQTVLSYSVISLRMFDMMCFFVVFILLSRNLNKEPSYKDSILLVCIMAVSSLFIGRGWGQAMLVTVFCVLIAYATVHMNALSKDKVLKSIILVGAAALLYVYVYQIGIDAKATKGNASLSSLFNLPSLIPFVLTLFGRTLSFQYINVAGGERIGLIMMVGSFVAATYALAIYLFFVKRQYNQGWFPLCLMIFSLVAVLFVYLGRGVELGGGWQGALFPRHLPECSVGLAGALTVIALEVRLSKYFAPAIVVTCIVLVASQTMAALNALDNSKYVASAIARRSEAFFGPVERFSDKNVVDKASCHSEEHCIYVRGIIDRYDLMRRGRDKMNAE